MNFKEFAHIDENTKLGDLLNEDSTGARFSVGVNFRSNMKEVAANFAKIALGYVSAAMKARGYHVKQVFDVPPMRILVSTRNWDDGEWVSIVSFNPEHDGGCFVIGKGFYNNDRTSVSVQGAPVKCKGDSAAGLTDELLNLMFKLKGEPDRHIQKLNPVPLKRGPK